MLQYVLTGLAGLALGIVIMRVWQARESATAAPGETKPAASATAATPARTRNLLYAAAALVVIAVGYIALRPASDETAPAARLGAASKADGLADVDTMISRLAERLKANPEDGEGFRMLGWSYVMTGRPEQAIEPYKRALELLPKNATVQAGYGEALVGVAGGTVTDEAKAAFDRARALDPKEPRSRYFLAMWLAQHGKKQEALDQWIALANDGPADAQWQSDLHGQIVKTSAELGIDVSGKLKNPAPSAAPGSPPQVTKANIDAANSLPAGQQQAMINDMVEGLADKLKSNPGDADGWVRLLRSRMVLKQSDQAGKDLAIARKALAGDAAGLKKVNDAASQYGVPGT